MALICVVQSISVALAESPAPENSSRGQRGEHDRQRAQVIYNLSSASRETAVNLHSQSKNVDTSLPVDPSMPISLQMARNNANAEAQQAQQQQQQQQAAQQHASPSPTASQIPRAAGSRGGRARRMQLPGGRAMQRGPGMMPPGQSHGHGRGHER